MNKTISALIFSLSLTTSLTALATGSEPPKITRKIGEGTSANTYLATWNSISVAYKALKEKENAAKQFRRERRILRKLNKHGGHPQIIELLGYVDDPTLGLILELMRGDLYTFKDYDLVTPADWHNLLTQIFLGLSYIHDHGYVFGDLKPDNILCSNKNGLLQFKLADFGWTSRPKSSEERRGKRPGALGYMAPEVFFLESFDQKADMWSAGVLVGGYLAGLNLETLVAPSHYRGEPLRTPADNFNFMQSFFEEARVRGYILAPFLDGPYRSLVERLCELNAEHRLNAPEALEHLRRIDPRDFVRFFRGTMGPTIIEPIGEGASSITYTAVYKGSRVAYKLMKDEAFTETFNSELLALRILHFEGTHPNIVELIAHIDLPGQRGFVLEIMDCDLFEALESGRVDADDTQDILIQVFQGLAHIHRCGLIYGDLKPENILCNLHDLPVRLKLADFGSTRQESDPKHNGHTTLEYVAPEVFLSAGNSVKADLWSAGLMVAELCDVDHENPQFASAPANWWDMSTREKVDHLTRFFEEAQKRGFIVTGSLKAPIRALVKQLCAIDPQRRLSAQDALAALCTMDADDFAPAEEVAQTHEGSAGESASESEGEATDTDEDKRPRGPVSFALNKLENIDERLSHLSEKHFGLPKETKRLLAQLENEEEPHAKARLDETILKSIENAPSSLLRYALMPLMMLQRAYKAKHL